MKDEDEEVIEEFLKENDDQIRRQVRKLAWGAKFRTLKRIAPTTAIGLFIVSIVAFGAVKFYNYADARHAIKDAELALEQEAARKAAASEAREVAQRAFVVVKYGANNVVTQCWVTKDKNNVEVNGGYGTASIYMGNWHDYKHFAKKLGATEPEKCEVFEWSGKD